MQRRWPQRPTTHQPTCRTHGVFVCVFVWVFKSLDHQLSMPFAVCIGAVLLQRALHLFQVCQVKQMPHIRSAEVMLALGKSFTDPVSLSSPHNKRRRSATRGKIPAHTIAFQMGVTHQRSGYTNIVDCHHRKKGAWAKQLKVALQNDRDHQRSTQLWLIQNLILENHCQNAGTVPVWNQLNPLEQNTNAGRTPLGRHGAGRSLPKGGGTCNLQPQ